MSRNPGKNVLRILLPLALIALALSLASPLSFARGGNPFQDLGIQVFKERPQAPEFSLPRINGDKILLADLKGKVVLINFFATWCTPCRFEMPEMEALYRAFKDKNFEILAVSIDRTAAPIRPFAESMELSFPIAHDPSLEVARRYGFRGPPLSYLIDRNGRVVGGAAGPRNWNSPLAHKIVEKLLSEPSF